MQVSRCALWASLLGALASSAAGAGLKASMFLQTVQQAITAQDLNQPTPPVPKDFNRPTPPVTKGADASGEPTSFRDAGCWKISSVVGQVDYEGPNLMRVSECHTFCQPKWREGVQFFGVTGGKKCWCGKVHDGVKKDGRSCDQPCAGDATEMCGGIDAANVYVMFDCTPPTPVEIAAKANATKTAIANRYASFKGQTCGQGSLNTIKIDGKETLVGTVEECKMACSKGGNSMQCHGFTYDAGATKCSFHMDILDGKGVKGKASSCFFKKLA